MNTPEEAKLTTIANEKADNNLSSVKIIRNSKGVNWEVKVYHEAPYNALAVAEDIERRLQVRYK